MLLLDFNCVFRNNYELMQNSLLILLYMQKMYEKPSKEVKAIQKEIKQYQKKIKGQYILCSIIHACILCKCVLVLPEARHEV